MLKSGLLYNGYDVGPDASLEQLSMEIECKSTLALLNCLIATFKRATMKLTLRIYFI